MGSIELDEDQGRWRTRRGRLRRAESWRGAAGIVGAMALGGSARPVHEEDEEEKGNTAAGEDKAGDGGCR